MQAPRLARDIMVTKLRTLTARTPVFDAIARLIKCKLTGAPVLDEQRNFLGVFSEKCCLRILVAAAQAATEENAKRRVPLAKHVMATNLVTLQPDMDVCDAVELLLKHRVSGAPVIDTQRRFLGSFSEKSSMTVLLGAAHDQLPTSRVEAYMDRDRDRTIDEREDLLSIARIFLNTPYRRLPVLRDGAVVMGQVSRRDVLRAAYSLSRDPSHRQAGLSSWLTEAGVESVPETEEVSAFMDRSAKTISEEVDLLDIAQIFQQTPYRRLPVLTDRKLVGQISRRDLLKATNDVIAVSPRRERSLLYLSALVAPGEAAIQ